jgi:hypothetical protein
MSKGERSPDGAQKAESRVRGRSSKSNTTGRFEKLRNERLDDGWEAAPDDRPNRVDTTLTAETAKVILSRNESSDKDRVTFWRCAPVQGPLHLGAALPSDTAVFETSLQATLARLIPA